MVDRDWRRGHRRDGARRSPRVAIREPFRGHAALDLRPVPARADPADRHGRPLAAISSLAGLRGDAGRRGAAGRRGRRAAGRAALARCLAPADRKPQDSQTATNRRRGGLADRLGRALRAPRLAANARREARRHPLGRRLRPGPLETARRLRRNLHDLLQEMGFAPPMEMFAVQGNCDPPGWEQIFAATGVNVVDARRTFHLGDVELTCLSLARIGRSRLDGCRCDAGPVSSRLGSQAQFCVGNDRGRPVAGRPHSRRPGAIADHRPAASPCRAFRGLGRPA